MSKRILVTGAAGFIGHKTCELLLKDGHTVIGLDNLNDYYNPEIKEKRLNDLKEYANFEFIKADIENIEALDLVFKNYKLQAVINLAARAGVRYSMDNPHCYVATNMSGCLNLLELMKKYHIKKFVLASTSSLYAGHELPFHENHHVNKPISPYAATKKGAEAMSYTYHHLYGIDVSVVRYFTVYGPNSRPDMAFEKFVQAIKNDETIEIYGDGDQARDFAYIDDIARGNILALKEVGYEVFNLGGGNKPISIKKLISLIEKNLNKTAKLKLGEFNPADMKETWSDNSKAKKLLGWEAQVSVEEGVKLSLNIH